MSEEQNPVDIPEEERAALGELEAMAEAPTTGGGSVDEPPPEPDAFESPAVQSSTSKAITKTLKMISRRIWPDDPLNEEECESLIDAWSPVAKKYAGELMEKFPEEAAAIAITGIVIGPRLLVSMFPGEEVAEEGTADA